MRVCSKYKKKETLKNIKKQKSKEWKYKNCAEGN